MDNRFSTTDIYEHDVLIVKRLGTIDKMVYCNSVRKAGYEERNPAKSKCTVNSHKLACNIIRAKNTVIEYALCNNWDYFVTLTLNKENYDRYDLNTFKSDLSTFLNNYNRNGRSVKYLLIPEMHKDGAWHMHGLLSGIAPKDLYKNKNGYLSWKQYDKKFGFISLSPIRDIAKCASYVSKYISKDLQDSIKELNAHLYYASKGLKRAERLYQGHATLLTEYDWESPDGLYKVKTIDNRKENYMEYLCTYDD